MEFEQRTVQRVDSKVESEEEVEEAPSLCDLVTENSALSVEWESSTTNHHDVFFEFAQTNSTANKFCPAEELLEQGHFLPLHAQTWGTQSNQQFSCSKSKSQHENRLLLHEKLDTWRTDSLGSGSSFISTKSQASQKKSNHSSYETFLQSKSTFQPNQTSKPPHLASKTRLKWQQFFSGGLIRTPPRNLQALRLKQGKPKASNNDLEKSVFKQSVSSNCEEGSMTWRKELKSVKFEEKCMSVKESVRGKKSIRSKGWKIVTPVINCLSIQCVGRAKESPQLLKKLPEVNQNSVNSKNGGARVHHSLLVRPRKRSRCFFYF